MVDKSKGHINFDTYINEKIKKDPGLKKELENIEIDIDKSMKNAEPISNCCKTPLITHQSDEGTGYYSCMKCGKPCDIHPEPIKQEGWDDWEKEFDKVLQESATAYGTTYPPNPELKNFIRNLLAEQRKSLKNERDTIGGTLGNQIDRLKQQHKSQLEGLITTFERKFDSYEVLTLLEIKTIIDELLKQ